MKISISVKTCSFAIFNFVILSTLMSDSPVLIPQSFFPHTISTIMVADDNTRDKNKDQIKNRFKTMNELAQLMV